MFGFRLRTAPGNVWPPVPPGEVSQFWALYLELEQTQWLSPAAIVEGQLAQARLLLAHCAAHVPYYQEALRRAGIRPAEVRTLDDFRRVPILSRRVYQEQFPRFQAANLPPDVVKAGQSSTSGTSGVPVTVWQTNRVALWWLACCLRDWVWSGLDTSGTLAVIRNLQVMGTDPARAAAGVTSPHWHAGLASVVETGPSYALAIQQEPRHQLDWLRGVRANYLLSYPSNAVLLAGLLRDSGERLPELRAIQVIAEELSEETQGYIESAFGVPVKNLYSCVEAGYLASPCPEGHGLHVHAENVLLEVLDEAGNPCAPGQTGRVVLTTLHNHLTPLLRYEIQDAATVGGACPCGRGLPLLTRVGGKQRPALRLPDGRLKDSSTLVASLRHVGGYHQHQIVQSAVDRVIIRLVPGPAWDQTHTARVVQCVQEYLEAPVRVDVQLVDRIEITPAGKLRDVMVDV